MTSVGYKGKTPKSQARPKSLHSKEDREIEVSDMKGRDKGEQQSIFNKAKREKHTETISNFKS